MSDLVANLDQLGADGRLASVMLVRTGNTWQTYIKLGRTSGYTSQSGDTPSEALDKALSALPACERYDLDNGFAVAAPAPIAVVRDLTADEKGKLMDHIKEAHANPPSLVQVEANTEDIGDLLG